MESLFDTKYVNAQPLRKLEPLIRFDVDGNPQPRKPLNAAPTLEEKVITNIARESKLSATTTKPHDDLKRKVEGPPPAGSEPKKKQPKQTKIMEFFKKG